ncbi:MAG: phosphoribosylaminoimidazolecarboxamide formyltransferase [Oscillospiraceae bacterium]|jgi:phosphoribosylaminoimidazolecarboxamide formyltransferase/IMP cyclohydrolase|nr:phosphoribosylaminoimidazolecarboxamide formyltransferase [Oscillospiraceae bacterium]
MDELILKYGLNPNQKPARICREGGLPLTVRNGRPGAINLLDALNGWQLVTEMKRITGRCAAASFKHVSPAGAAVAPAVTGQSAVPAAAGAEFPNQNKSNKHSALCEAYIRARGGDPMSSFGDFIALSDICDVDTAAVIRREVSDGIIAPGYEPGALDILQKKRGGEYCVLEIDREYEPDPIERRDVFGITFEQGRNSLQIDRSLLSNIVSNNKTLPESAVEDLLLAQAILKYTQSNSVCYVLDGQAIGIGAGQQSRIHCTRLAGDKADRWWLRRHPNVLELSFAKGVSGPDRNNAIDLYLGGEPFDTGVFIVPPKPLTDVERASWLEKLSGVALGSDAFFPFSDNIERAHRSGVKYIAQPGGSKRDADVIEACDKYGMVMCMTGVRLFHH